MIDPDAKAFIDLLNNVANMNRGPNLVELPPTPTRRDTANLTTQSRTMPTITKPQPSAVVLAARKHFQASVKQGISPNSVPQLSTDELLAKFGENTNTPLGRIRQTLNSTFTGEALAAAISAVDEYATSPQEYARHSLSVADVVKLSLTDLDTGVGLPESARKAIDAEQEAVAVLRSTKGLW
jgi:hypothetical protein